MDALPDDVLVTKAGKKVKGRFGGSRYEDDNVISDGSVIAVNDGQCMMIVDQGRIVDFCAEPGEYVFDQNGEPSIFYGELNGEKLKAILKTTFDRLSFGGQAGRDTRVYFFNTKEIIGNKYGTPSTVPFRVVDSNIGLDMDVSIRCFGEYSYRMGGAQKGEIASLLAVRALRPVKFSEVAQAFPAFVRQANEAICARMRCQGRRMGSTLTALHLSGDQATFANVGDSRIYLLREGANLLRLTRDHSKAQQLIDLKILTPEQARRHPSRHELTRHLGVYPDEMELQPELGVSASLKPGDCFLLCSDGLYDGLTDDRIESILSGRGAARKKAEALVQQALDNGSRDNVTALVVQLQNRMGWMSWIRTIIRNTSRSSACGKSKSCSVKAVAARFSSWNGRILALYTRWR